MQLCFLTKLFDSSIIYTKQQHSKHSYLFDANSSDRTKAIAFKLQQTNLTLVAQASKIN